MEHPSVETIENLKRLVKDYDGLTNLIVQTKQRIAARNPGLNADQLEKGPYKFDSVLNGYTGTKREAQGLEQIKGRVSRRLEKEIVFWRIWNEWLKHIPGIGPWIGGRLIIAYYYRFMPVCPKCHENLVKKEIDEKNVFWCERGKKSVKGDGVSTYALEYKQFNNISAWRSYMGYQINEDGKMPKREKGKKSNWSTKNRTTGYMIGDQFNRPPMDCPYRIYFRKIKEQYHANEAYKDYSKGHIHAMARHRTIKLFLSHFWDVDQRLKGVKAPTHPWIIQFGGHTDYTPP